MTSGKIKLFLDHSQAWKKYSENDLRQTKSVLRSFSGKLMFHTLAPLHKPPGETFTTWYFDKDFKHRWIKHLLTE